MTPPHPWTATLDSLEVIAAHDPTREVVLRIAGLAHTGRLPHFRNVVIADPELDEDTRAWVLDLARDEAFLLAAELYLVRSRELN